jgi:peptidyl-prolyl cis-trans isomerase SurA
METTGTGDGKMDKRSFFCRNEVWAAVVLCVTTMVVTPSPSPAAELVDRIVAIVNNDVISQTELERAMNPYREKVLDSGYPPDKERQMLAKVRHEVLGQLIDQKLTDQEIAKYKLVVTEKEIDQSIERIKQINSISDQQFLDALARENMTMVSYREKMREQLLRANLLNREIKSKIVITREEIKAYYDSHPEKYGVEESVYLKNFYAKPPLSTSGVTGAKIREVMKGILEKLKQDAQPETVIQYAGENGVSVQHLDLGLFRIQALAPDIREAIARLSAGEYSDVIETEQGYQIFYIKEFAKTAGKTLEQAAPEIESIMFKEIVDTRFAKWLDELRSRSHIQIVD